MPGPAYLVNLPNELLCKIVECLVKWEVKHFSLVNRRMRDVSLPFLYRNFRFTFSKKGLDRLEGFLRSNLCHHVVSIQYVVPELLNPGESSHTSSQ
jgi:hypothetical protein